MANNPYVNKVVFGSATLVDLTGTTATADKILSGYGAFGADGAWMDGTATGGGSGGGHLTQDQDGFLVIPPDGGGGGSWQTVFEGSVTTTLESSASIQGLDYNELSNSIKVTFNGVEYSCEKNADDSFGATYDESTQAYDWSEYPFAIYPNSSGNSGYIDTETAGTYTLKIETPQSGGGSDFSTATVTVTTTLNVPMYFPVKEEDPELGEMIFCVHSGGGVYDVVMFNGKCGFFINVDDGVDTVNVTGACQYFGGGMVLVTGDCTITIS